jgi:hypothetical protein
MKIIENIWSRESGKKKDKDKSLAVAERLSTLLEADNTKLSAITHHASVSAADSPAESSVTATRPVSPPASAPTNAMEAARTHAQVVDSIARASREAVEKLQAAQQEMEASFRARTEEHQKMLLKLASSALQRSGFQQRVIKAAADELEETVKAHLARASRQIHEQVEAAQALLEERLQGAAAPAGAGSAEQREAASRALASVLEAAEQAVARLAATQREIEARFQTQAQEFEKRLAEAAAEELERKRISGKLVEQTSAAIERSAGELLVRSAQDLRRQAEAARKALDDELRATRESILAEMRAQISSAVKPEMNQAAMAAAKQAAEQAEAARREAEAATGSVTQAVERALGKLAATQKEIESSFETRANEYQKRLVEAAAEEIGRRGIAGELSAQAAEKLASIASDLVARSGEELRRQVQAAQAILNEELDAKQKSLLAETHAQLTQASEPARQQAEAAAHSLAQAAEEALQRLASKQRELQDEFKRQSEKYQKMLVEAATAELERQGVSDRLVEKAAKELERSAGELLVRSAGELRRQAETARGALDEQLRVARESFVIEVRQRLASAAQPTIKQHVEAVRQNAQAAVDSLQQAAQQAMADLAKTQRELELSFKAEAKGHQQRLVDAAAEELKRQGIPQQILQEAIGELERATREFVDRSTQELRQQAVATLAAVEQQMRAKTDTLIAETHEEIASLIRKPREALQKMLNDALARVVDQLRAEQVELIRKEQAPLRRQLAYLDAVTQEARAQLPRPTFSGKELRSAGALATVVVFAMVMVGWAAYFATRPVQQFRGDPPTAFADQNPNWTAKRRGKEAELAKAYWAAGLRDVENNNYSFGVSLPEDPPPDFVVEDKSLPDSEAARWRYWEKFREYWADPNSWQAGPRSQAEWVQNGANWVQATLKRFPGTYAVQYNLMKLMDKFQLWWFSRGGS